MPILGFTWYSLTDQIDWDTGLREQNHRVNPRGLFDLERRVRPVGPAYRQLIIDWAELLPTRSVCLARADCHAVEYTSGDADRHRAEMQSKRAAEPTESPAP